MAQLLVSVRSAEEAAAALEGGAALIDVKEPARGSLGRATVSVVRAVVGFIAGRRPVSMALGEFLDTPELPAAHGLAYGKWGLAGCGDRSDWPKRLATAAEQLRQTVCGCRLVAAAYADWRRALAPSPEDVLNFAQKHGGAFLLDTWQKDGSTLLDWLSPHEIERLCTRCRETGLPVALAGSLGPAQLVLLREAAPDWFAVRRAACRDGQRQQTIDPAAVRSLVDLVSADVPTAAG